MPKHRLALAVFVLAPVLLACAPSPEDYCRHNLQLLQQEEKVKEDQIETKLRYCIKQVTKKKESMDKKEYKELSKCVMGADSIAEAQECQIEIAEADGSKKSNGTVDRAKTRAKQRATGKVRSKLRL